MPSFPGQYRETGKGQYRHMTANWKAALLANAGDLIYQDPADATAAGAPYDKSAALFTWTTDLLTTQLAFAPLFRGVSEVRRIVGQTTAGTETTDGGILSSGEFTFPCNALGAAVIAGALVTIAQGTGNTLNAAKVVTTTNPLIAIGRVTEAAAIGATRLTFEMLPATFGNGPVVANTGVGAPPSLSFTNGITAFAGGGQGSAVLLTASVNRITIVATAADSVKLPVSVAGTKITVINAAAANAANIFPATGEVINALAANTAISIAANKVMEFYCAVAGTWNSVLTA